MSSIQLRMGRVRSGWMGKGETGGWPIPVGLNGGGGGEDGGLLMEMNI